MYYGNSVIIFLSNINGKETLVTYVQSKHHDLRIQTMYSGKRKSLAITPSDVDIWEYPKVCVNLQTDVR